MTKRSQSISLLKVLLAIAAAACFSVGTRPEGGAVHRQSRTITNSAADKATVAGRLSAFPITFESNVGQSDPRVRYLSHGRNSTLFIAGDEAVLSLAAPRPALNRESLSKSLKSSSRSAGPDVLTIHFLGSNGATRVEGSGRLRGRVNYFIGNDPKRWHRNVPTWRAIVARDVWPSANIRYHGEGGQLEFDIELKPGADASAVRLGIEGASSIRSTDDGDLMMRLKSNTMILRRPRIYQEANNRQMGVDGHFVIVSQLGARNRSIRRAGDEVEVGFSLAQYDHKLPLIIDPTLTYSTFLGGSGAPTREIGDSINAVAVDSAGNAYVGGLTGSPDFPTTSGAFQSVCPATVFCVVGFITKLDPSGGSFQYATFLGGSGGGNPEPVIGIAVDQSGDAYVSGEDDSSDFPTTPGVLQPTGDGGSYVAKLSPDGSSLLFSTYLNGMYGTYIGGIAVDGAGDAYVTGQAVPPFPVTPNGSFNSGLNAGLFAMELNPTGSQVLFSALFNSGIGKAIALGGDGYIYVAGSDSAGLITTTSTAFQTGCAGCGNVGTESTEGFLTVLNPAATTPHSALIYSTYFGGSQPGSFYNGINTGDAVMGMAVDSMGRAYLDGVTGRTDFPTTAGAYQNSCLRSSAGNCDNAFLAVINPSHAGVASLVYSSYLGGHGWTYGNALAVDESGRAYIAGQTFAEDFPVTANAVETDCLYCGQPPATQTYDSAAFFTVLNPFASSQAGQLVYSTYLGGTGTTGNPANEDAANAIAIDASGSAYVAGQTFSTDFPVTPRAAQTVCPACAAQNSDAFISKIDPSAGSLIYSTFLGGSGTRTGGDGATGVASPEARACPW